LGDWVHQHKFYFLIFQISEWSILDMQPSTEKLKKSHREGAFQNPQKPSYADLKVAGSTQIRTFSPVDAQP